MSQLLQRFLSFDRLIGPRLVKIVYYFGAAMIVLALGGALLSAIFALAGGNFSTGLMQLIAAPAVGAVGLVYWRFLCELFMLAFLAYERLGEVRDLMRIGVGQAQAAPVAAEPDPNHPAF
jgi:hypothetical protein